ncbi:MAG: hypothetical protein R8K48_00280 [Gallionella sp.]
MKVRINSISIAHAKPGMTAGKSVFNQLGQVLIQEGVKLNTALLLSLARRHIAHIPVLVEDPRTEAELSAEREKVAARLNTLVVRCLMRVVFKMVVYAFPLGGCAGGSLCVMRGRLNTHRR